MEKKLNRKRSVLKKGICFFFLLFSVFWTFPLFATVHVVLQQQAKEKKVTIDKTKVPVKEILEEIKRQTDFNFMINAGFIADLGKRTLKVDRVTMDEALLVLLQGTKYTYQIVNNHITFVLKSEKKVNPEEPDGLVTVKGKVMDAETKLPIPGVTVLIVGSTKGTATNEEGAFAIMVGGNDELQFSYIGMIPEKRKVTKALNYLEIYLHPDVKEIEEVIVTGIVDRKAESFTGSALTIRGKN